MAPSPVSRLAPGIPNGQRSPASILKHKERHRLAAQSPSLPFTPLPTDHPVEVVGRIRDHAEGLEGACMLEVLNQGPTIRVKTDQGYRDFGLDGVSLAEREDLQSFYEKYVESRIEMVKMGGRCTIMMYGPTGAGKSYTMFGSTKERGIVYRALEKILGGIGEGTSSDTPIKNFAVSVTILEIYNEEAFDLLASSNTSSGHWPKSSRVRLEIMGKKAKNALSISGSNAEKISKDIAKVEKRRVVRSTLCNERSSRSHCLVMVDVPALGGRLVLVDMAGSENLEQAGLGSESRLQTCKINQGNIALKRVVEAIANGDPYIPFRDSKLTMLLQDSFEDDESKILMILCASTNPKDIHKTIGTLEYGSKAKCIIRLPTSPEKEKIDIDRLDHSALESRIQNMDAYICKLESDNLKKDREKEEICKKLMHRDSDMVALRKLLGQIEQEHQERCNMIHNDDCKAEMEKKLEECQRTADELIELGNKSLEEKVSEQQREINMMRCRMEELEREVQLLLKVNLQPCFVKQALVPQEAYQAGNLGCKAPEDNFDISEQDGSSRPCCMESLTEVADADVREDATECSSFKECSKADISTKCLDVQVSSVLAKEGTSPPCEQEMCVTTGLLWDITEESESEDCIPEKQASRSTSEHVHVQDSNPEEKNVQMAHYDKLSFSQENGTMDTCLVHTPAKANTDCEKTCGLMTASRRSRIENIFMLCGHQRELIITHSDLGNMQVEEHRHQSKDVPADSISLCVRSGFNSPTCTAESLDSVRKISASPKNTPVHTVPPKSKQMSSDSTPVHGTGQLSSENTPPDGRPPILASSIFETQSVKSQSFDGVSSIRALDMNQDAANHDADSCEVFVKWETSRDSCGKLIKILSMDPNASLALLRKAVESNVIKAKHDFTFLMLGDPSGAPVKRDNEANLTVASLPDCHKKQGSKLACLRPQLWQGIETVSPLSPMENKIPQSPSHLCMWPSDLTSDTLKSAETPISCRIVDGEQPPLSAEKAKIKQKLRFLASPLLKGLRL